MYLVLYYYHNRHDDKSKRGGGGCGYAARDDAEARPIESHPYIIMLYG